MSRILINIILSFFVLSGALAQAGDTLTFHKMRLKWYPRVQLVIPRLQNASRLYLTSNFKADIAMIYASVDDKMIVKTTGTKQTTSMPPELLEGYGKSFTEVAVFPLEPIRAAKQSVIIGIELENGKESRIVLTGKHLSEVLNQLP